MAVEKDYEFVFDDGAVHRLQAKTKSKATMLLSAACPDRVGQTAHGSDENGGVFKATILKLEQADD